MDAHVKDEAAEEAFLRTWGQRKRVTKRVLDRCSAVAPRVPKKRKEVQHQKRKRNRRTPC